MTCKECGYDFTDLDEGCDDCIGFKEGVYLEPGTVVAPVTIIGETPFVATVVWQDQAAPWDYHLRRDHEDGSSLLLTVAPGNIDRLVAPPEPIAPLAEFYGTLTSPVDEPTVFHDWDMNDWEPAPTLSDHARAILEAGEAPRPVNEELLVPRMCGKPLTLNDSTNGPFETICRCMLRRDGTCPAGCV